NPGTPRPQYSHSRYARLFSPATFSRYFTSRGHLRHAQTSSATTRKAASRFTCALRAPPRSARLDCASHPCGHTAASPCRVRSPAASPLPAGLFSLPARRGSASRILPISPDRARTISAAHRSAQSLSSTNPRGPVLSSCRAATGGPLASEIHLRPTASHRHVSLESSRTSPENLQHLFVQQAVRADESSFVNRTLAVNRRRPSAGLFHDQAERRQVPRLGDPVQGHIHRAFGHQHVLPEAADRTAAARRIHKKANRGAHLHVLAG